MERKRLAKLAAHQASHAPGQTATGAGNAGETTKEAEDRAGVERIDRDGRRCRRDQRADSRDDPEAERAGGEVLPSRSVQWPAPPAMAETIAIPPKKIIQTIPRANRIVPMMPRILPAVASP